MEYPRFEQDQASALGMGEVLADVSRWIDDAPRNKLNTFTENLLLRTSVKIGEEKGELNEAIISMLGQNPRKLGGASMSDVQKELLDVALTALGGVEHINGNDGMSIVRLADHIVRVANRMVASQAEAKAKRAEFDQILKAEHPVDERLAEFFDGVKAEAEAAAQPVDERLAAIRRLSGTDR